MAAPPGGRRVSRAASARGAASSAAPVHTTYLWHMHQPIYWPDEHVEPGARTSAPTRRSRSGTRENDEFDIFDKDDRVGDYQDYPRDADLLDSRPPRRRRAGQLRRRADRERHEPRRQRVERRALRVRTGTQTYRDARGWTTSGGRPRLRPGARRAPPRHRPADGRERVPQGRCRSQKARIRRPGATRTTRSGFFPAEMCFSRAADPRARRRGGRVGRSSRTSTSRARAPTTRTAPTRTTATRRTRPTRSTRAGLLLRADHQPRASRVKVPPPYGFRPHYARYVDPATGAESKIVVVPAANAMRGTKATASTAPARSTRSPSYNDPAQPDALPLRPRRRQRLVAAATPTTTRT